MKRRCSWLLVGACIIQGLLADGHTPRRAIAQSQSGLITLRVERIAVVPFFKGRCGADIAEALDCPLSRLYFNPETLASDCDRILTRYVQEALKKRLEDKVIPLAQVTEKYQQIPKDKTTDTLRILAQKLGEVLGANLIIVGTVWRCKDRDTADVESPGSSVAFAICLIDVADAKMTWKGKFDKTQQSLADDVSKARNAFKKGVKWLSANELAQYGVREIFKKFPL